MSLESYLREIRDQRDREFAKDKATQPAPPENNSQPKIIYVERPRRPFPKSIIFIVLAIIIAVAVIRNPSESESRKLINSFLVEKVKDYINVYLLSNPQLDFLQRSLGSLFVNEMAPKMIEAGTQTNVWNFYLFSAFKVEMDPAQEKKNLVSGIIFFGKIIPLSTDIDFDNIDFDDIEKMLK
ncbi:MAG: hypothetical protein K2N08_04195 [Muribaculaceae bacterium]|nr:hypothetical protein [Muribaculaceae bacterium]